MPDAAREQVEQQKSVETPQAADPLRTEAEKGVTMPRIGTCPDCFPPFEWPPNEPKEEKPEKK